MSVLLDFLSKSSIKSASARGRSISIRFGTNDIRDVSDGHFPVDVIRCNRSADGSISHPLSGHAKDPASLKRAVKRVSDSSYAGAVAQWVEIRTPAERVAVAAGDGTESAQAAASPLEPRR
jgi:hypothetical protein